MRPARIRPGNSSSNARQNISQGNSRSMASNKLRNTSLPHANHPKVPTGSSLKRSGSDESSIRRNLKRPSIESSQIGDDIDNEDVIFRPWRSLSNPPDNVDEESESKKSKAIEFVCEELRSLGSDMDPIAMALKKGNLRNYSEKQLYDEITQVIAMLAFHLFFPPPDFWVNFFLGFQ
ncbi:hypothetical protein Cgig2_012112 [Carnegiea gigantea]|uniref:Uncharacterized protein n=1 Tax=Carnegiea gigantea TaxID=171969 RepID=A0A9Q1K109_9CARY|nr:hypothetical protein Cgig2_012112 [Carnegiea gigantea]